MNLFKKLHLRKFFYHAKYKYFTFNNLVITVAFLIALSWVWGSISVMQRNYALQRKLDMKQRQLTLNSLQVKTLEYEKKYHASAEYIELSARENLGLATPGEKVLILPENSQNAKRFDEKQNKTQVTVVKNEEPSSNIEKWINFLFGVNAHKLQK